MKLNINIFEYLWFFLGVWDIKLLTQENIMMPKGNINIVDPK